MSILSTVWGFIAPFASKILIYLLAVILGISLIYNAVDYFKIHSLDSQVTKLNNDATDYQNQLKSKDATIADQNGKIIQAGKDSLALQQKLSATQQDLTTQQTTNDALIQRLKSQPTPKTCNDAVNYLKTNSDVFKW